MLTTEVWRRVMGYSDLLCFGYVSKLCLNFMNEDKAYPYDVGDFFHDCVDAYLLQRGMNGKRITRSWELMNFLTMSGGVNIPWTIGNRGHIDCVAEKGFVRSVDGRILFRAIGAFPAKKRYRFDFENFVIMEN